MTQTKEERDAFFRNRDKQRKIDGLRKDINRQRVAIEQLTKAKALAAERNDPEFVEMIEDDMNERRKEITAKQREIILIETDASLIARDRAY